MTDGVKFSAGAGRCYMEHYRRQGAISVNEKRVGAQTRVVFGDNDPKFVPICRIQRYVLRGRFAEVDVVVSDIAVESVYFQSAEIGLGAAVNARGVVVTGDQGKA